MKVGDQINIAYLGDLSNGGYPFGRGKIPVKILGEYEHFWLAKVLPHRNIRGLMSRPYNITMHKKDVKSGIFSIAE